MRLSEEELMGIGGSHVWGMEQPIETLKEKVKQPESKVIDYLKELLKKEKPDNHGFILSAIRDVKLCNDIRQK